MQRSVLGHWRFARAVRMRSPLLAALQPRFDELRVGMCRAQMPAHRRIRLADGGIDPLAISALAQLAATMVIEVSAPESLSWSARGLTVEYLRRTEIGLAATARLDKTDWAESGLLGVPVTIGELGAAGAEIARAVVSFAVAVRTG